MLSLGTGLTGYGFAFSVLIYMYIIFSFLPSSLPPFALGPIPDELGRLSDCCFNKKIKKWARGLCETVTEVSPFLGEGLWSIEGPLPWERARHCDLGTLCCHT